MISFADLQVIEAAAVVQPLLPETPRVAIILGSGLSDFSANLSDPVTIPYDSIPHFPAPTVPGHVGELVWGRVGSLPVLTARGRFHYYEGHELDILTLPVRLFAELGTRMVIITNAAGCVDTSWDVGDLMLITGHLDFRYADTVDEPEPVTHGGLYRPDALMLARDAATETGIALREGYYGWAPGPTFETPAEIRHFRNLGCSAVGMSTVPEIEAATAAGLTVIGISCLTNYAAGISGNPLNHDEVLETGQRVKETFARLVIAILGKLET